MCDRASARECTARLQKVTFRPSCSCPAVVAVRVSEPARELAGLVRIRVALERAIKGEVSEAAALLASVKA
jgi:hypothetical protein